jgi:hypothetical protein
MGLFLQFRLLPSKNKQLTRFVERLPAAGSNNPPSLKILKTGRIMFR